MFDINDAFIQAMQKQELEEGLDYGDESMNITTSGDDEDARNYYGKNMTKRNRVRSLDQAQRNLKRAATDDRIGNGQIVDQISFEDTLNKDLDTYKFRKDMARIHRGENPKYNKDLTVNGKSKLEPTDNNLDAADRWDKEAKDVADKIRTNHNKKKEEKAGITVTQDVNSEKDAIDLVNDSSYFKVGDEVEVNDWNGRTYKVKKTKDIKYKYGKRIEESEKKDEIFDIDVNANDINSNNTTNLDLGGLGDIGSLLGESKQPDEDLIIRIANKQADRMSKADGAIDTQATYRNCLKALKDNPAEALKICMLDFNGIDEKDIPAKDMGYYEDLKELEKQLNEDKKEELFNVNIDAGDIGSNNSTSLDLGGLGALAGLLASEEPKESEEKLEEDTGKKSLTYQYEENGNYFYKDDNGTIYVDMSFQPDSVDLWICSAEYNEPIKQVNANEFELNGNPKTDKNFERNEKYKGSYMLLSRLESDCKYYLGNGNRNEKVLWAGSVDKQITKMKELWNSFPDDMKPEWLSIENIENYEKEMKKKVENKNKKLKKEAMEKEKAEKFGITDNLNKLTNDLMALEFVTKVDYDLDGYYDNMKAPITLVSFDIDVEDEEYSAINYMKAKKQLKQQILDVMKNNGVNVELDEFEDNDTYFYIVAYSTNWNTDKKTEAEGVKDDTIKTYELNTDLIPILNMYQYQLADGVDISQEELNNVMKDEAMPIIEEVIKGILPSAEVTAGDFYNPPYYRFGSGNNDQLDFTVKVPYADFEKLLFDTISYADFDEFLHKTYKSYDGFISYMADNLKDFDKQEDWKVFVSILTYYIKPYEHQDEFTNNVLEYIWSNFPAEGDDYYENDDETNYAAEEEAEATERFEDRYMNGGNGFTADKKDESKEQLKETDADKYKRILDEPRTENYKKGLQLRDEIVNAWKNGDLETAYNKWEELFNLFSTGYDDEGNTTDEWTDEQATRDMIELHQITDTIENNCVYDVCDYGKQKAYREMGYNM